LFNITGSADTSDSAMRISPKKQYFVAIKRHAWKEKMQRNSETTETAETAETVRANLNKWHFLTPMVALGLILWLTKNLKVNRWREKKCVPYVVCSRIANVGRGIILLPPTQP
jgi:hypothetical protein